MTRIDPNGAIHFPYSSARFDFVATIPGNGVDNRQKRIDVSSLVPDDEGVLHPDLIRHAFRVAAEAMIDGLRRLPSDPQGITPTEE